MATSSLQEKKITFTICFENSRLTLTIPKSIKVYEVLQKAADEFKVKPEGLGFLYNGLKVPEEITVEEALAKAGAVTVIHMIRITSTKKGALTTQVMATDKPQEALHAFCKDCSGLVSARAVFLCPNCKEADNFHRSLPEPIDHFSKDIKPNQLKGSCTKCCKEGQASIIYCCKSCDNRPVAVLRQIRDNLPYVPCMVCTQQTDRIFIFSPCQHCMCLECFGNFCKQQLSVENFQQFSDLGLGYSISCPGPGEKCKMAVIADPHHFRVVDEDGMFYKEFSDKAVMVFQPAGDAVLCRCKHVIDMSRGKEVPVETEPAVTVSGLRWYQRLWPRKKPPPPKTRRRASCTHCHTNHCLECKQLWHEGDCQKLSREEEKAFPVDPHKLSKSVWPNK